MAESIADMMHRHAAEVVRVEHDVAMGGAEVRQRRGSDREVATPDESGASDGAVPDEHGDRMSGLPMSLWDDPDEDCFEGRCLIRQWIPKIEPFQPVRFVYPDWEYESVGKAITAHVDAEARSRREERIRVDRRSRWAALGDKIRRANEEVMAQRDAMPDHLATGW